MGNASLIEFRKSLNLKQNEIAKEIGVSPSYYYKVESGYQNPSYEFLAKFKIPWCEYWCSVLLVDLGKFIGFIDAKVDIKTKRQ